MASGTQANTDANQRPAANMTPAARSNPPHGYKALIVHPNGRTEILAARFAVAADGRDTRRVRAGRNFASRDEALAFATQAIERRLGFRAEREAARTKRN